MQQLTRRTFLITSGAGALGLACSTASLPGGEKSWPRGLAPIYTAESPNSFPVLEVTGTPYEVGRAAGERFGGLIRQGLDRRREWFEDLMSFARGRGARALEGFEGAAKKFTPRAFEELIGLADGSGLSPELLLVLNHKAELTALKRKETANVKTAAEEDVPGCATVICARNGRVLHVHNEDGLDAYIGLMFLLRVRPEVGQPYESLCYPGILPGNGPSINGHGLIQTTNFINSNTVRVGVGRYFLNRTVLEAKSIEEAIEISTHPERAYGYHHVFTDLPKGRSVAVEVASDSFQAQELDGLYVHTNHFIMSEMKTAPQHQPYIKSSSASRYRELSDWKIENETADDLAAEDLLEAISSHDGQPVPPCRHPHDDIHGATLGTAVWDSNRGGTRLYKTQPCHRVFKDYPLIASPSDTQTPSGMGKGF